MKSLQRENIHAHTCDKKNREEPESKRHNTIQNEDNRKGQRHIPQSLDEFLRTGFTDTGAGCVIV